MRQSTLVFACFLLLRASGWAQPPASLELTSVPPQALIFLDRVIIGKGHVQMTVPAGTHLLRVAAGDDYEPYTRNLELTAEQPTRLKVQLAPSASRWLQQGRQQLGQNQFDIAARSFSRCEVKLPVDAAWWQGIALWKSGKREEALAQFRRYAQFVTDAPELYLFLGLLHAQAGRSGEAFTAYKTALLLPKELGPQVLQGLPEATYDSIKAMGQPTQIQDKVRLAQLLMLKGQIVEALTEIQSAIQDHFGSWTQRDWVAFQPKVPNTKTESVAVPEDEVK